MRQKSAALVLCLLFFLPYFANAETFNFRAGGLTARNVSGRGARVLPRNAEVLPEDLLFRADRIEVRSEDLLFRADQIEVRRKNILYRVDRIIYGDDRCFIDSVGSVQTIEERDSGG